MAKTLTPISTETMKEVFSEALRNDGLAGTLTKAMFEELLTVKEVRSFLKLYKEMSSEGKTSEEITKKLEGIITFRRLQNGGTKMG